MTANLKDALAQTVIGQTRAIESLNDHFGWWQAEASPRFPLCLLVSGPTSTGKEHLARSLADARFDGRIAVHSVRSDGRMCQNRRLAEHRGAPAVLFVKMFNEAGEDLAALDALLSTGGIILGNGETMNLADWVVMLSASHVYSETLAEAVRSNPEEGLQMELGRRFPWVTEALDGVVQFDPLAPEALVDIAFQAAHRISVVHSVPLGITTRAAEAIARYGNTRSMDAPIRLALARTGLLPDQREELAVLGQAILIDYVNDTFKTSICKAADLPDPKRTADTPSPAPAPAFNLTPRDRPDHIPALDWRTEHRFDAFISYKFRKHHKLARALFEELKGIGYSIWFDADEIGTPEDREVDWSKDHLIERLVEGVGGSRTTIVFEAALEAVAIPLGVTQEQAEAEALARGNVMYDSFGLVAWNWQKLEIDSSSRLITIREDKSGYVVLRGTERMSHPSLGAGPFRFETVPAVVARALGEILEGSGD